MTEAASPFTPEMIAETFGTLPAPEQQAEPPPVEAPAESQPAPESKEPTASARITAAKRMQQRVEAQRQEAAKERAAIDAEKKQLAAQAEEIRLFEEDPAAFTARKNWTPAQHAAFLEKYAGQHKPEVVTDRKLSAVEQELADLKTKLAAKERAEQTAEQQAATETASAEFVARVTENAEKYPHLTQEYDEKTAVSAALAELHAVIGNDSEGKPVTRVAAFVRAHGRSPTNDEIAEYLDGVAKARIEARGKSAWRKQGDAPSGSQPSLGESNPAPPVNKGTSPRSLSRTDASQRAALPLNAKWTQEAADAESLRILEKMMASKG